MPEQELQRQIDELKNELDSLKNNPVGVFTDIKTKDNIDVIISDRIHRIMWDKVFYHSSIFESVDRYTATGDVAVSTTGLTVGTGSGSAVCTLAIDPDTVLDANHETYFSVVVSIDDVSASVFSAEILSGTSGGYVAINIDEGTIQGLSNDGSSTTTLDLGTTTDGTVVLLECVYYPGNRVDFYVDGILKGTVTSNLNDITTPVNKVVGISMDPNTGGAPVAVATLTHYKILQKQD